MGIRTSFKLGCITANMIPRSARANENVHRNLNTRIVVQATKGDAVDVTVMGPTKRRTAGSAKLESESRGGLISD